MSKPKELRGPDFTHGYPFAELRDGAMLLGHADGEPALLAWRPSRRQRADGRHLTVEGIAT
jgi:hypothetical protein